MCDHDYLLLVELHDVLELAQHVLGLVLSLWALHQALPEKAKAKSSDWQANNRKSRKPI